MKTIIKNSPALRSRPPFYILRSTFYTNVLVLTLILTMFAACSKYEDGPWISFRSPEKRITSHYWDVESFKKNDIDFTAEWKDNYDWGFDFEEHDENHPETPTSELNVFVISPIYSYGVGGWHFHDINFEADLYDKTKVSIGFTLVDNTGSVMDTIGLYPLQSGISIEYNITRLTSKEMWWEYTDSLNNVYTIKLK